MTIFSPEIIRSTENTNNNICVHVILYTSISFNLHNCGMYIPLPFFR